MKKVSAIITVYNGEKYLAEAIESVLAQEYPADELIVVDDGSTDATAKIAQSFKEKIRYVYQENTGAPIARNNGVELALGDTIAFLDADDTWTTDKLKKQIAAIEQDPSLDMVLGHVQQFLEKEADPRLLNPANEILAGHVVGAMLIKKDSFYKAGCFSNEWKVGDVFDWYSRALECGLKVRMLPDVILRRRIHTENMGIVQRDCQASEYLKVIKTILDRKRKIST